VFLLFEAKGETRAYRDLEVIFREGDPGSEMFVIKSGKVKITKKVRGIVANIAVLQPGDFLAEMALFDDQPRSATATAVGRVELITYDKDSLGESIKGDPAMAFRMLETMSKRLRKIDDEVATLIAKGLLPKEEAERIRRYTFAGTFD
jgi:CRP-like cAMP-binding protein